MIQNLQSETSSAPLIRWAGSKRKLLRKIIAKMPDSFDRYIEPFAGSACLFFAIEPQKAIISDLNASLIETYRTVTKHSIRVLHLARSFPNNAENYYYVRDKIVEPKSPIRRAARFLYLNRFCFNALYRTNKQGHFNVPFGSRTGNFPSDEAFRRRADLLGRATLACADFQTTIRKVQRGDFVYLDPPYVTSNRTDRTEYGPNSFSVGDIPRLIQSLEEIHAAGARFLLSYCICPDLLRLLPCKVSLAAERGRTERETPARAPGVAVVARWRGLARRRAAGVVRSCGLENHARKQFCKTFEHGLRPRV